MKALIGRWLRMKDSTPHLPIVTPYMSVGWEIVYLFEDCISKAPFSVVNLRFGTTAEHEFRGGQFACLNLRHFCIDFDAIGLEHRVIVVCE